MKNNIILIGMPGAGKSTLGVILAKVLAMDFVDCDLVIQKREGRSLSRIIEEEGAEGFIKTEERINASLSCENCVIATGGSAVYGKKAMENFKKNGIVVYLKLSYENVSARVHNIKGRGVVLKEGQTFKELFEERSGLYEKYADLIINEDGLSAEQTLSEVIKALEGKLTRPQHGAS